MTVVSTETNEVFESATEDECTICNDEIIGDSSFVYDQCSFVCQRTDMIGEVCRYTDTSNSIRSQGTTMDMIMTVDKEQCCSTGLMIGDSTLEAACDLSGNVPPSCFPTEDERVDEDLVFENGDCVQNFKIITYRIIENMRNFESEVDDSEIVSLDLCCQEFADGDNSMQDACIIMD